MVEMKSEDGSVVLTVAMDLTANVHDYNQPLSFEPLPAQAEKASTY